MTVNAYLFMWNSYGVEAIVPITQYEYQDKLDTWAILKGELPGNNPLGGIITSMKLRARFNNDRSYEIYAMDCEETITEEDLWQLWDKSPQAAADLTREKGICLFSDRRHNRPVKIT